MKILLDDGKFKDYTQIHKSDIGVDLFASASGLVTGIGLIVPSVSNLINNGFTSISDWILAIVGVIAMSYGFYKLIKYAGTKYSAEILYKDVKNMDETEHRFSLVAVKDTFNDHPNRFLLHYDEDWQCNLFFSFRTKENEHEDMENIKERLSNHLKIDVSDINVEYKNETLQTKFSERDKVNKLYNHKLYSATIRVWPDNEKHTNFTIDGINYRWTTIAEMRKDPDIQKKNIDVVDFVSANIS